MPLPESTWKKKIVSCTGKTSTFTCPFRLTCKLFHNRGERNIWEKIRPPMRKGDDCPIRNINQL